MTMMETARVVLSAIEPRDIAAIVRWRNLPDVYRGFIEYEPLGTTQQAAFLSGLTPASSRRLWLINATDQCRAILCPSARSASWTSTGETAAASSGPFHRRAGLSRPGSRQGCRGARARLLLQPPRPAQGDRARHREQRRGHPTSTRQPASRTTSCFASTSSGRGNSKGSTSCPVLPMSSGSAFRQDGRQSRSVASVRRQGAAREPPAWRATMRSSGAVPPRA